jgi:hypothetical protein
MASCCGVGCACEQPSRHQHRHSSLDVALFMTMSPDAKHDDIIYPSAIPFVLVHLGCIAAIWSGVTLQAIAICTALYLLRIFAIGAGYHRYFSHRAFSTSRVFQFALRSLPRVVPRRAFCGGLPSTGITICTPTPAKMCIHPGTRVSCTAMLGGFLSASTT